MFSNSIVSYMVTWPSCPCEYESRHSYFSTRGIQGMQSCSEVSSKGTGMGPLHWMWLPNPQAPYQMKLKNTQAGTIHVTPRLSFSINWTVGGRWRKERRKSGKKKETKGGKKAKRKARKDGGEISKGIGDTLR